MSLKKEKPVHLISHTWFMSDVPQSVIVARDTFTMFQEIYETTHPSFKPSPEVEAESFTSFVYKQGGRDAVRWLAKNGVVAKPIVKRFLAGVTS